MNDSLRDVGSQLAPIPFEPMNGSLTTQAGPDPFRLARDWRFVVLNERDQTIMVRCSYPYGAGLHVAHSRAPDIKRFVEGECVIIVAPEEGAGVDEAIRLTNDLRHLTEKIVMWQCPGLGNEDVPDLVTYEAFYGQGEEGSLAKTLVICAPWRKAPFTPTPGLPRANGNGKHAASPEPVFDPKTATNEELGLICAADVEEEEIPYLWPDRLTLGEMALLAGAPGIGKTTIAIELGARITTGSPWPDGCGSAPIGQVAFMGAEDSMKTTLKPRFVAAGADVKKVFFQKGLFITKDPDGNKRVNYTSFTDLDWWKWWLDRLPDIRLLVVDPVVSYLGRGVNDQRNSELRAVFDRFIDEIVRPRQFCFYALTHFSKKVDMTNPLEKITGSGAYAAVPRHVHFAYPSHKQRGAAIFVQIKGTNAAADLPWLHYVIDKRDIARGEKQIRTSSIVFLDMLTDMHQQDLTPIMTGQRERPGPDPDTATKLAEWLWSRLLGGEWFPRRVLAREAIGSGKITGNSRSAASLDRGRKLIPKLHAGWHVEVKEMDFGEGQAKRRLKGWRLVEKVKDDTRPTDLPF